MNEIWMNSKFSFTKETIKQKMYVRNISSVCYFEIKENLEVDIKEFDCWLRNTRFYIDAKLNSALNEHDD